MSLTLGPRSMYLLRGPSRTEWEHSISGTKPYAIPSPSDPPRPGRQPVSRRLTSGRREDTGAGVEGGRDGTQAEGVEEVGTIREPTCNGPHVALPDRRATAPTWTRRHSLRAVRGAPAQLRDHLHRRPGVRRRRRLRREGVRDAEPRPDGPRGPAVHQLPRRPAGLLGLAARHCSPAATPTGSASTARSGPKAAHGIADTRDDAGPAVKQKGYATGMAGKWHLGHHPAVPAHPPRLRRVPRPALLQRHVAPPSGGQARRLPAAAADRGRPGRRSRRLRHEDQEQLTTRYTERAVSFIERNKDRPFFFYLAHSMPHVPLHVSDKFRGKSRQGLYGDVIMEIDWRVGRGAGRAEAQRAGRDTLVIFTSDNGPWLSYGDHAGSAGPLREGKGTSWEGGTREPCIMRWPGRIPAGTRCDAMADDHRSLPDDRQARRRGAAGPQDRRPGHLADPRRPSPARRTRTRRTIATTRVNQLQAVTSGDGRWKLQLPHTYRTLGGRPGGHGGKPARYENRKLEQAGAVRPSHRPRRDNGRSRPAPRDRPAAPGPGGEGARGPRRLAHGPDGLRGARTRPGSGPARFRLPSVSRLAAHPVSEGLAAVCFTNSWGEAGDYGFVDRSGERVIPPRFSSARPFRDGLAAVRLRDGWRAYRRVR